MKYYPSVLPGKLFNRILFKIHSQIGVDIRKIKIFLGQRLFVKE